MISKATCFALTVCFTATMLPAVMPVLAQQTAQARTVRPADISGDLLDLPNANDEKPTTRATSGKTDYVGMSVTIDAGSLQNIIGVKQDFGRWPTHYPGSYKVEVAESLSGPWMTAFEGLGQRGESRVEFPAILARYVRITATATNKTFQQEWSIAELKLGVDPGQTAARIPKRTEPIPEPRPAPPAAPTLKDIGLATDKKLDTRSSSGTPS
jgi:hypothetical protein